MVGMALNPRPRPRAFREPVEPEQPLRVYTNSGIRVRQLDWEDATANAPYEESGRSQMIWQAKTAFGLYRITRIRFTRDEDIEVEAWYVHRPGARNTGPYSDAVTAKTAAQGDFEERILASIEG